MANVEERVKMLRVNSFESKTAHSDERVKLMRVNSLDSNVSSKVSFKSPVKDADIENIKSPSKRKVSAIKGKSDVVSLCFVAYFVKTFFPCQLLVIFCPLIVNYCLLFTSRHVNVFQFFYPLSSLPRPCPS